VVDGDLEVPGQPRKKKKGLGDPMSMEKAGHFFGTPVIPSYSRKCKIGVESRPAWAKRETLSQK
jgi:hypothetical protein